MPTVKSSIKVLHFEDDELDRVFVREKLRTEGLDCVIVPVGTLESLETELLEHEFDLIISDSSFSSFNGLTGLKLARKLSPRTPFVFFSGTMDEKLARDCIHNGASDYVSKQLPDRLAPVVRRILSCVATHARLQQTQEKNRQQACLLENTADAMLVCDPNQRIVYWNPSAERIYGWSSEEVIGKDVVQVLFQGTPIQEMIRQAAEDGEWTGELQQFSKDGNAIFVKGRLRLFSHDARQPASLLFVNTDITECKRNEEHFLRSQRLESLGALVSGIIHDLNNALTPALIGVNMLRNSVSENDSVLTAVEISIRRSVDMVRQMLAFARGGDCRKTLVNVESIMQEVLRTLTHTFPKNIHCEMKFAGEHYPVFGIPTQVYQVLMNLCVNARDAMPAGGMLTLTAENVRIDAAGAESSPDARPGDYVCIGVEDSGIGISPEQMRNLFQPFFTTKSRAAGTGLGLYTSLGIAKNHGGFISVSSRPGQGTQFRFHLPATSPAAPADEIPR